MTSNEIAIKADGLGKMYRLGREIPCASTLPGKIRNTVSAPFEWLSEQIRKPDKNELLWALKDVSFEIKRGEVVGFIGHNGAGKSTLLKLLSRITEPTTGYADIHGRIAALLEVGTGMHPELTGRENIYMNGTVLGMKKREIDFRFDEIVDFSGISKFIDTAVKRYSSGMRVRLGFAIAAHLNPEILVVDEVLAVGDAEFQSRCIGRMSEVASSGRTVLFVSHNMGAILNLCKRVMVLDRGSVVDDGVPNRCIAKYYRDEECQLGHGHIGNVSRQGSGAAKVTMFQVFDINGDKVHTLIGGDTYRFQLHVESVKPINWKRVNVGFNISTQEGILLAYLDDSYTDGCENDSMSTSKDYVCEIERFPLIAGKYAIGIFVRYNNEMSDHISRALSIDVDKGNFYKSGKQAMRAPIMLDYQWSYD
jgi:lipopolysaccharide transport system ATP-binding protein